MEVLLYHLLVLVLFIDIEIFIAKVETPFSLRFGNLIKLIKKVWKLSLGKHLMPRYLNINRHGRQNMV